MNILPQLQIVSRSHARANGLTRYFTGKQCGRGHLAERMVSGCYCCECKKIAENSNNNSTIYRKARYTRKRTEILRKAKEAYDIRGPKISYTAQWRRLNVDKIKNYRQTNAGLYAFHASKRRKQVRIATPPWADMNAIKAIYIEAARISVETGIPHEVDHIIPLTHDLVCGLHCVDNLQIIPALDNRSKNNKFKPYSSLS